ncbi:hypothetical protein AYO20_07866 [Fonsecaea nubica]|uniref:Uncharacterized protein n=1 Tax=Fonsecaea nubica TaxID=856822 RepID=A0A178CSY3_9EURO|nr:hypothetical protein AYO20_07866 [Fonsecaea nubica]OAL32556.1 hypothetical protein AYO20_07866 [Fonsecaea nubica]
MARLLEGKFGVVTGGSRGIGEAIANNLASKGCNLLLVYTSDSSTAPTMQLCATFSATHIIKCYPVQANLSDPKSASEKILVAAKQYFSSSPSSSTTAFSPEDTTTTATLQIDIIVNNAGVAFNQALPDVTLDEFTRHYTINVLAPLILLQTLLPYLPKDRSGRIVNVSSVGSSLGFPNQTVYGGTKAALEAMTRTWARELADRCTVNAVNPGPVKGVMYEGAGEGFWRDLQGWQDHTPLSKVEDSCGDKDADNAVFLKLVREKMGGRRPAYASEVAGVVGMLCTADAAWCTGSVVCANGGMRMNE